MIQPEDFAQHWGAELVTIPPALMQAARVPSPAKEFLALAGLPRQAPMPTGGAGDFALAPVEVAPDQDGEPKYPLLRRLGQTSYLVLGFLKAEPSERMDAYFCVQEVEGGIWMVGGDDPALFINSSVPHFAFALLAYRDFLRLVDSDWEGRPNKASRRLRELAKSLRQDDPSAFLAPEYFWPMMLKDLAVMSDLDF